MGFGEVAEWTKAADSKSVVGNPYRGFESHPLRFPIRFAADPLWWKLSVGKMPAFGQVQRDPSRVGIGVVSWRGDRVDEGARLEIVWASKASRGFESRPLRHPVLLAIPSVAPVLRGSGVVVGPC